MVNKGVQGIHMDTSPPSLHSYSRATDVVVLTTHESYRSLHPPHDTTIMTNNTPGFFEGVRLAAAQSAIEKAAYFYAYSTMRVRTCVCV